MNSLGTSNLEIFFFAIRLYFLFDSRQGRGVLLFSKVSALVLGIIELLIEWGVFRGGKVVGT
jgi:hypothetical protein